MKTSEFWAGDVCNKLDQNNVENIGDGAGSGSGRGDDSVYFNGLIAHPKIFKRALSPSEIKTLYMFLDDVEKIVKDLKYVKD